MESKCKLMSYCFVRCFLASLKERQPLSNGCACLATHNISIQAIKKKKNVPQGCPSKGRIGREFTHLQSHWPKCGPFNFPAFLVALNGPYPWESQDPPPHTHAWCSFASRIAGRSQKLWASEPHQHLARVDPHPNSWDGVRKLRLQGRWGQEHLRCVR